jgi:hypothetical protein
LTEVFGAGDKSGKSSTPKKRAAAAKKATGTKAR